MIPDVPPILYPNFEVFVPKKIKLLKKIKDERTWKVGEITTAERVPNGIWRIMNDEHEVMGDGIPGVDFEFI